MAIECACANTGVNTCCLKCADQCKHMCYVSRGEEDCIAFDIPRAKRIQEVAEQRETTHELDLNVPFFDPT